ncbi:MAG: glucans biosynthesis glucosyltransferase MdoH [Alphaproteobacteria bacterium]|nr:glucans biosynthesis glucosyltransferase MdoH [Alphaproteobacteria bacterium]
MSIFDTTADTEAVASSNKLHSISDTALIDERAARRRAVRALPLRRAAMAALVVATTAGLIFWMGRLLGADGVNVWDIALLVCFAGTLPWVVIGLWNSVIGAALLRFDPEWRRNVVPIRGLKDTSSPIRGRTAIIMPIYNEQPDRVVRHLAAVEASVRETGQASGIEYFLLSDTQDPEVYDQEVMHFELWRARLANPSRVHYRRRSDNRRQKVGNIEDFCARWGDGFKYMLVLDADSVMSGDKVLQMIRVMEANPKLGIFQSLVVGMPSTSGFGRIFQFGMRHGMRAYTTGSAWWQGDAGPYWGHNAILRLKPFREHCVLPRLTGEGPLGGEILSHDQVEAALMRSAGYQVRVDPMEGGSYEENPPTVLDFIKRDLRWCQGNMQYLGLLHWSCWKPMGRLQLILAILMYLSAPLWLGFVLLSITRIVVTSFAPGLELAIAPAVVERVGQFEGIALFATMMTIVFAPKIFGMIEALVSAPKRHDYGGGWRLLLSGAVEIVFGTLLAPIMAVAQTVFIAGLFLGRKLTWAGQVRDVRRVSLGEAMRGLWPQTLIGVLMVAALAVFAPGALPWAGPMVIALGLAIPFAVLSAHPAFGRFSQRIRLCMTPEEVHPSPIIQAAMSSPAGPRPPLSDLSVIAPARGEVGETLAA